MSLSFQDRVAARAADLRLARLVLSVLAAPFYALGWLVGVLLVALSWMLAAAQVGMMDARARRTESPDDAG